MALCEKWTTRKNIWASIISAEDDEMSKFKSVWIKNAGSYSFQISLFQKIFPLACAYLVCTLFGTLCIQLFEAKQNQKFPSPGDWSHTESQKTPATFKSAIHFCPEWSSHTWIALSTGVNTLKTHKGWIWEPVAQTAFMGDSRVKKERKKERNFLLQMPHMHALIFCKLWFQKNYIVITAAEKAAVSLLIAP